MMSEKDFATGTYIPGEDNERRPRETIAEITLRAINNRRKAKYRRGHPPSLDEQRVQFREIGEKHPLDEE